MLAVHLRINDSQTRLPIPIRIMISGPDGESYAPLGSSVEFSLGFGEDVGCRIRQGQATAFHVPGQCEIRLPSGKPLRVRATKGLEYQPLDETVTLGAGQMALRFEMSRWWNRNDDGWMAADARAHFQTPHSAALESAAEDLDLTNLLVREHLYLASDGNTYQSTPNLAAWSGQSPALSMHDSLIVVNTWNTHRLLGSLGLLNSHRPIYPLAFGQPYSSDDWSLVDWCQQCHRKKGLVTWTDAFQPEGGEALVAAILGQIDALEWSAGPRKVPLIQWYYRLLNAGVRLPLVGASAKSNNRVSLGSIRTYAMVDSQNRTYSGWVEAVRSGRTFVTNGPILKQTETANGWMVHAECMTAFERLEIVRDGEVVSSTVPVKENARWIARLEHGHTTNSCWIAARCVGGESPLDPGATNFAHSSPVFGDSKIRDEESVHALIGCIDRVRDWAGSQAQFSESKWRDQLLKNCSEAEGILRSAIR